MGKVYRLCEINEPLEIAFFFREFECPQCGGGGEVRHFF